MEYDETKAIEFINKQLSEAGRDIYPDDEILNVIDMIWDYYEENGLLDIDDSDDDDDYATEEEVCDYVKRMVKKDKAAQIKEDDIAFIVKAEIEYESTLDPF